MKASTLTSKVSGLLTKAAAVLFWLMLWQISSMALAKSLLLPSPLAVLARLMTLSREYAFWHAVGFSFGKIALGFLSATATGLLLASAASRFTAVRILLSPLMEAVKASPVASFIILLLLWIPSRNLSIAISFLMVLPIIYTNLCAGITATDSRMLELAEVFRTGPMRRLRYLYLYQVLPYFRSACAVSLGLCWKSGIAAEVIGLPRGSIGERLYQAKIYLDIPDLFAWTIVVVLMSMLFGRLFLRLLDTLVQQLERM